MIPAGKVSGSVIYRNQTEPSGFVQFPDGFLHVNRSHFDIVLDAVKKGALINDESRKVFEELGESSNAIGDFSKLTIPRAKIHGRLDMG